MIRTLLIALFLMVLTDASAQNIYKPVDDGSKVHFVIKNFGINTGGDLKGLTGTIDFDAARFNTATINVTVNVKTIDTDNKMRDDHLRSASYFDAEKYSSINIKSTKITMVKDAKSQWYNFSGTLTMHGVTKNILFPFTIQQIGKDMVFKGSFDINRSDFGVGGNGGVLGSTVKISLSVLAKRV